MITISLQTFCDRMVEKACIDINDVRELQRDVLADGFISRDDADMLIALDRAVTAADAGWADFLIASLVDFAVWASRPTDYVDQDTAHWLIRSLCCGQGPTTTAMRAAFEIVKEAQQVDQSLLAFVMGAPQGRWSETSKTATIGLAA